MVHLPGEQKGLAQQGQGVRGQVEAGCWSRGKPMSKVLREQEHSLSEKLQRKEARPRVGEGKSRRRHSWRLVRSCAGHLPVGNAPSGTVTHFLGSQWDAIGVITEAA